MSDYYTTTEQLRRKAWESGALYEQTGNAAYLAEERALRGEIERRHLAEHCDNCGTDPDDDGHCECTGTAVGGDIVLVNEWAPGDVADETRRSA